MRLIQQSYNIIVGVTTDEFNLEHNGKAGGMKSLHTESVLKSGVPNPHKIYKNIKAEETFDKIMWIKL